MGVVRDFAIQADKSTAAYTTAFVNATGIKTPGAPRIAGYFGATTTAEEEWKKEAADAGMDPDNVGAFMSSSAVGHQTGTKREAGNNMHGEEEDDGVDGMVTNALCLYSVAENALAKAAGQLS